MIVCEAKIQGKQFLNTSTLKESSLVSLAHFRLLTLSVTIPIPTGHLLCLNVQQIQLLLLSQLFLLGHSSALLSDTEKGPRMSSFKTPSRFSKKDLRCQRNPQTQEEKAGRGVGQFLPMPQDWSCGETGLSF